MFTNFSEVYLDYTFMQQSNFCPKQTCTNAFLFGLLSLSFDLTAPDLTFISVIYSEVILYYLFKLTIYSHL